ncbi:hypothetical protein LguiB_003939 [Lonicera macranthoides]
MIFNDLQNEHITFLEAFIAGCLIEKLPDSWKDYKNNMKYKRKQTSLADVVIHIRIEEHNKKRDMSSLSKEFQSKVNIIEGSSSKPRGNLRKHNKQNNKNLQAQSSEFKRKTKCYFCGKEGHKAFQCKNRKDNKNNHPPKANIVEGDVIAAVITEVNMVAEKKCWVVNSGATRHIYANRESFSNYTPMREGEEQVYMGDSRPTPVLGK